jgi:hypothetical protein
MDVTVKHCASLYTVYLHLDLLSAMLSTTQSMGSFFV